jgi:hypothetical protein
MRSRGLRRRRAREGDLDPKPALGAGLELERAAVRGGDRSDDRET